VLLGVLLPQTLDGTIQGTPRTAADDAIVPRNCRRFFGRVHIVVASFGMWNVFGPREPRVRFLEETGIPAAVMDNQTISQFDVVAGLYRHRLVGQQGGVYVAHVRVGN
jgi:hypothetical protein